MGYQGMKNIPVMGMNGFGDQSILIDFERGRIVATQAIHSNYNWSRLVHEPIRDGKPASISTTEVKQPAKPVIDPQQLILDNEAKQEDERKAKQYWDDYYAKIFGEASADWGASADGSTMFSEDFENLDERDLRVNDERKKWNIKQDNDGNSIYCNEVTDDWAEFTFGSKDWSDYSISYRMRFSAGKGGELETHIRKTNDGDYRSNINLSGRAKLEFAKSVDRFYESIAGGIASTKADEWSEIQLIASGNNIKYLVDGKVVASAKDNRVKKGAGMIAVTANSEVCIDNIVVNKETTKVETTKVETSDSDPTVSKVIEVTNGDKLIVDIAEPHELAGSNIKVQLKDIDAPDATKSCPAQIKLGTEVKDFVAQKLENASSIKLTNFRKTNTKIIAQVVVDGIDLGDELVSKGYASEEYGYWKPYFCSALSATNQADQYRRDTDEKKAIFWYERSIVLDPDGSSNSRSLFRLYQMYSNFGNTDKSLENLKKSASLGWVPSMEQLGSDYLDGNGVKKDSNQGKKWLKKAFDKGSQRAEDIYCGSLPKAKQNTCKF